MNARISIALASLGLCASMVVAGQTVEIAGSLRNASGELLSGTVDVFEEGPDLRVATHSVSEGRDFRISARTRHGILVRASADGYPPDERYIRPGSSGRMRIDFEFPDAQDLSGRVVDVAGRGVPAATVHVRYHEPDRPLRRAAFHAFHRTDGDGYFELSDVGADVPFFVDAHAPGYRPASSERMVLEQGQTDVGEVVLEEEGGTVIVQVLDRSGSPVEGAQVALLADPAGYRSHERGSLLHGRGFHQRSTTSGFGNVRFSGVPGGRIRLHAIAPAGEVRFETAVAEKQTLEVSLETP